MRTRNTAYLIRHYERRIAKCLKEAERAYSRNHNIIGCDFMNKMVFYENKLRELV